MRKNYPLLSNELNDKFQTLYYRLTYILGYDNINGDRTYIGEFDKIEHDLREALYLILFQLNTTQTGLVINKGTNMEIELYTEWGRNIVINELRSM